MDLSLLSRIVHFLGILILKKITLRQFNLITRDVRTGIVRWDKAGRNPAIIRGM